MKVGLKLDSSDLERLIIEVGKKVAEKTAAIASDMYNTAISYQVRWSGTYRASWQVTFDGESPFKLEHPTNRGGLPNITYPAPSKQQVLPNYANPYGKIYIQNTASHAALVEYVGTPKHPEPWMVATHTKNNVLAKYRFY